MRAEARIVRRGRRFQSYFFFAFLAPDFFAPPPEFDFDLVFADFEAVDILAPLPFFAGAD